MDSKTWWESLSQKEKDEFNKIFREETRAKVIARGADAIEEMNRGRDDE